MVKYRNVRTGRILERPTQDEWLEASTGWERIDEPSLEPAAEDPNERTDDGWS
jgi:hypothetical protein